MQNTSSTTRKLVITAVLIAISIVLSIPLNMGPFISLGFIALGPVIAITIMHVPAIIGGILEGPWVGLVVGGAFGVFSLFLASQQPAGSPNAIFVDPIISVVPRLFIGPVAWLVYTGLRSANMQLRLIFSAVAGTLTNTLLVIGAIALRLNVPFFATLASVSVNLVLELIVASVIVVAVVSALRGTASGRTGSSV
ncbi:ECF transporter S component [Caldilinea sp.]|uniref:ECF transporter S component n=1 Tax=Caldilinea sp. TaxID=2293560 RepID=UPI002B52E2B2|nr:ECF transporter S component [Caldilinea sp.]HRA68369.1 ECF transporter S component [Caldilinea sp.]